MGDNALQSIPEANTMDAAFPNSLGGSAKKAKSGLSSILPGSQQKKKRITQSTLNFLMEKHFSNLEQIEEFPATEDGFFKKSGASNNEN
mmetsp:Transcript_35940/g.55219  ORF Transcript_35940/g.55219 Transcript_35940/m.55219 type:complete len:89 (+) Transcript_35940:1085-1351(+)